jgi:hypothetical protein
LQAVFFPECLLERVKVSVFGHALDRNDIGAISLNRKHRARLDGKAIRQDSASPANTRVAADVRTGESCDVTNKVRQQQARFDIAFV